MMVVLRGWRGLSTFVSLCGLQTLEAIDQVCQAGVGRVAEAVSVRKDLDGPVSRRCARIELKAQLKVTGTFALAEAVSGLTWIGHGEGGQVGVYYRESAMGSKYAKPILT